MNRQQDQSQTESTQGQVHGTKGLDLSELEASDQHAGFIFACPGPVSNGRGVQRHVEVRAHIEVRMSEAPSFHLSRPALFAKQPLESFVKKGRCSSRWEPAAAKRKGKSFTYSSMQLQKPDR